MADELRVDTRFADAARDQLRVLGAEVQDEDELTPRRGRVLGDRVPGVSQRALPIPTC